MSSQHKESGKARRSRSFPSLPFAAQHQAAMGVAGSSPRSNAARPARAPRSVRSLTPVRQVPGPVGGKRDVNRRKHEQRILVAARRLFLRRGIDCVTVDQIATRARIAKGSFYRYYRNQAALVRALFAPIEQRLAAIYAACSAGLAETQDPSGLLGAYIALGGSLAALLNDAPEEVLLYLQECRGPKSTSRQPIHRVAELLLQQTRQVTEQAMQHGLLRRADPYLTALAVIGSTERVMYAHLTDQDAQPSIAAGPALIELFLSGVINQDLR
ncbi:MAG: TetR/AcrR family transcriptional regulator [Myxococcales bacterium]|nr:TetR/AcrR family transcriptional regulator [Myxococcales bacterium]